MSPFRILAATLALFIGLQALPAGAAAATPGRGAPVAHT
ncbi:multidrug transporter, partial [Pseudomonas congelans]